MTALLVNHLLNIAPEVEMKILSGVIAVLVLAVAVMGYQLKASVGREAVATKALEGAERALAQAERENTRLDDRFETLDAAMTGLSNTIALNQGDLRRRLESIKTIVQEPGDSDESVACLDVRVPAQLSRSVQ